MTSAPMLCAMLSLLSWSWLIGSVGGTTVRLHWTVLMTCLFAGVEAAQAGLWGILFPAILVPVLVVACHALAVRGMVALTQGRLRQATLWAGGTMQELEQPTRPGPVFLVAAAGPVALAGLCAALHWGLLPLLINQAQMWTWLAKNATFSCGLIALMNLLPHAWFDGGRLWRSMLWRPLGLRHACTVTAILGIVIGVIAVGYGILKTNPMSLLTGVFLLVSSVQERRALRDGWDPVLNRELVTINAGTGWWEQWQTHRRDAARVRVERELDDEQATLDRLLAKVSELGLPSLTAGERTTLQRISERQRKRAN